MLDDNCEYLPGLYPSVARRSKNTISVQWTYVRDDSWMPVDLFLLEYKSTLDPEYIEVDLGPSQRLYNIENCSPGTKYSVILSSVDINGRTIIRAKPLIEETLGSIERPVLRLLHNEPGAIKIGWDRPKEYGGAGIKEYALQVNGTHHANIISTKTEVTYLEAKELRTYTFRLQAISKIPDCDSNFSHILDVTCPGALPLTLERAHSRTTNKVKVAWNKPICQGAARVREYRIFYRQYDNRIRKQQPGRKDIIENADILHTLTPSSVEDSLKVNPHKYYWAVLEAEIVPDGCRNLFTPPVQLHAAKRPVSPEISVDVYGLKERLAFGKEMAYLIDKRDRLKKNISSVVGSVVSKGERVTDEEVQRRQVLLHRVEKRLKELLKTINEYTGTLSVVVKWKTPNFDDFSEPMGYRILVNNEIHAENLPLDTTEYCIKLSVDEPFYNISVTTLSGHAVGHSKPSETIQISSSEFRPVRFFCHFNNHKQHASWPDTSGCRLEDTLDYEKPDSINRFPQKSFISERVHAQSFEAMRVFDGKWEAIGRHFGSPRPTALLFWTKWCGSSKRAMEYYTSFAKAYRDQYQFLTCCVFSGEAMVDHQSKVKNVMAQNNWNEDDGVEHFCACHPGPNSKLRRRDVENSAFARAYKLLGVPTLVLIDGEGYIAWQGRVFGDNAETFTNYLRHTLSVIEKAECPIKHCDHCDSERYGVLYSEREKMRFTAKDLTIEQFNVMMRKQVDKLGEEPAMIYTKGARKGNPSITVAECQENGDQYRDMQATNRSVTSSGSCSFRSNESHSHSQDSHSPTSNGHSPTFDDQSSRCSSQDSKDNESAGLASTWPHFQYKHGNIEQEGGLKRCKSVSFQEKSTNNKPETGKSSRPKSRNFSTPSERRAVSALPNIGRSREKLNLPQRPKTASSANSFPRRSNQYSHITSQYNQQTYKPYNPYRGASYAKNGSVMSFYSRCGYIPKKPFPTDKGFPQVSWKSSREIRKQKVPLHREVKHMRDSDDRYK